MASNWLRNWLNPTPRPRHRSARLPLHLEELEHRNLPSVAQFGVNLIANGDAESGIGSATGNDLESIPSWQVTGNATVVQYTAGGIFPTASSGGSANVGNNFFAGGPNNASSSLAQTIDVSSLASSIDTGTVSYDLTGFLGGSGTNSGDAKLTATFLNGSNQSLGSAFLGPITPSNRGNSTGYVLVLFDQDLPSGTRSISMDLQFTGSGSGYDSGFADNLALVLSPAPSQIEFNTSTPSVNATDGLATITVTRTNPSAGTVAVQYATSDGTGVNGTDYTATSGSLQLFQGQMSKTFTIPIMANGQVGTTKTVNLTLSDALGGNLGSPSTAVLTINENALPHPGTLQWQLASTSVHSADGSAQLVITRTNGTDGTVQVQVSTADNTAMANTDYTTFDQTVTFQPGDTSQTVTIPLIANPVVHAREAFTVTLSSPTGGATLGSQTQTSVIITTSAGTANERYVAQVFMDLFLRPVDQGGLAFFSNLLDQGQQLSSISASLAHSAEYYATNVIKPAYLKFLGRAADQGGINFWVSQMVGGVSDQQLAADLVGSAEYFQAHGGTAKGFVDAAYTDLLGRAPDPGGEAFWISQVNAAVNLIAVALGIAGSQESNGDLIQQVYQRFLNRAADSGGLAFWLSQLVNGSRIEDIVTSFVDSIEYFHDATN